MSHAKIRTTSLICLAMALLVTVGSLVAGRPTLAAPAAAAITTATSATVRFDQPPVAIGKTDYGTATTSATVNVKLRHAVTTTEQAGRGVSLGSNSLLTSRTQSLLADLTTAKLFTLSTTERQALSQPDSSDRSRLAAPDAGSDLTGLDGWYTVSVPAGTDLDGFVRKLATDPNVEEAYVNPVGLNASLDYTGSQSYVLAAPDGIGAAVAHKLAGGKGQNVRIFDIEGNWDTAHEDLARAAGSFIANGTFLDNVSGTSHPYRNFDHGTAVLGQLIGTANGFGVTGIAPKARIGLVNASNREHRNAIPQAIALAAAHAKPGDVILIEQQYAKTPGGKDYVPVEYYRADHDAIKAAVAKGVIVVEAAANGYLNLNNLLRYGDSGAIMVGAGQVAGCSDWGPGSAARSRAAFSNYGSTVDLQGPGECVVTTGYGDLAGPAHSQTAYTAHFSGTSSASPVVAGSAALISSIIEERTGRAARPAEVRSLLIKTGTPQDNSVGGHIGPMPNLAKAVAALPGGSSGESNQGGDTTKPTVSLHVAPGRDFVLPDSGRLPTTVWWSAKDASGIARYALLVSTDDSAWVDAQLNSARTTKITYSLKPGHTYRFAVAARDGAGNWSDWKLSAKLTPSFDPDTDPNLAYAGHWTRRNWAPAAGGQVTATNTAGDTVTVNFKARAIGWVASLGQTRGKAHVWLDGRDMGVINLYRNKTHAQAIVFSASVSGSVTHKLVIKAIGTIDVDGLVFLS